MANADAALSMGAETLEEALKAVKVAEALLTTLSNASGSDIILNDFELVVKIDGEIIGRVQIEDYSFAAFIPNGDWCGFNVEAMG